MLQTMWPRAFLPRHRRLAAAMRPSQSRTSTGEHDDSPRRSHASREHRARTRGARSDDGHELPRDSHTFTVPGLHVNEIIRPAHGNAPTQTTFTFTPDGWGTFAWHCAICPSGIHGKHHIMSGSLYVIFNPSALP